MNTEKWEGKRAPLESALLAAAFAIVAGMGAAVAMASIDAFWDNDPVIGQVMPDGTRYAGVSWNMGKSFYAAATDEAGVYTWAAGKARCESKGKGWGLPIAEQLNHLYKHRAAIGGFNKRGSNPHGMYWASTAHPDNRDDARLQYFGDGDRYWGSKEGNRARVRCVMTR